ncbi:holin [Eubacterium maltosivorans]|uniref:Holin n=2 Tax=Eubacterium maltosivorans TaxID=2041044 RepID=A0A4P9CF89_EUBML|nr:phage holin family protein [Eubacterium maltosivorans]QCT73605.1 holin [Eubacterium maltosivorans]
MIAKGPVIMGITGTILSTVATYFGGWDTALQTLVILMLIDYVTGLIVAGVFKNSTKTETGALESKAGFKGLLRKGVALMVVLIACRLDMLIGTNFVRDAAVIAYCINEILSIVENAGLMGVPIPEPITKAIEILKNKNEEKESGGTK